MRKKAKQAIVIDPKDIPSSSILMEQISQPIVYVNKFEPLSQECSRSFSEVVAQVVKEVGSIFPLKILSIMYGLYFPAKKGVMEEKYLDQEEDCEVKQEAQVITIGVDTRNKEKLAITYG